MIENLESIYLSPPCIPPWNLTFPYFWGILHTEPILMQVYLAQLNITHKSQSTEQTINQYTGNTRFQQNHNFAPSNSKLARFFYKFSQFFTGWIDLSRSFITSNQTRDFY